jgi:hypothetical protein
MNDVEYISKVWFMHCATYFLFSLFAWLILALKATSKLMLKIGVSEIMLKKFIYKTLEIFKIWSTKYEFLNLQTIKIKVMKIST